VDNEVIAMAAVTATSRQGAYQVSVVTPISEIAADLQQLLTRRMTAYLANVKDAKAVVRWAESDNPGIRPASEQRLRVAYEIVRMFADAGETERTTRAWFLGLNPHLDDTPPAEAIHDGRMKEALAAARAFVADSY
jgi:hypothetical protein